MHTAVKLEVTISKDHVVQLPADLPEGRAEVIVLYPEEAASAPAPRRARKAKPERVDYFARLRSYQPRPLSKRASRALDEADRGER
jgi:hypothetical protein